jgi:hypothetical protein
MTHELDPLTILEIAIRAQVDPRSVRKRLGGGRVRGLAGARIERALAERQTPPEDTEPPRPGLAVTRESRAADRRKGAARGAA